MTSALDISAPPCRSLPVKLAVELTLYGLGSLLTAGVTIGTAAYLLERASQELLAGGPPGYQAVVLAVLVLILGLRLSYFLLLALRHHFEQGRRPPPDPVRWPSVSILVPAYNEQATIAAALHSLLALDYPSYEIVVVDDGSSDGTLAIARALEGNHHGVAMRVFAKPNGGKWSAHNLAFRHAKGDLILCVDADSRLEPDALRHLVRALLRDDRIGGVAGQVRVRNRVNLLTRLQAIEYLNCNGSTRSAQSCQGSVLVVPGPIGLFRTDVAREVWDRFGRRAAPMRPGEIDGPYEHDTFAEDFDFSLAVLALGHRVVYEPRAISNTKAPESVLGLLNQRYRWLRGSIQVLRKLWRRAKTEPELLDPTLLRWVLLTYVVDLVLVPVWLLLGLPYVVMTFVHGGHLASSLIALFALYVGINALLALCYASTHGDEKRLALVLPFQDLYQTFLLQGILAFVLFDEVRGAPMRWS